MKPESNVTNVNEKPVILCESNEMCKDNDMCNINQNVPNSVNQSSVNAVDSESALVHGSECVIMTLSGRPQMTNL